MLQWSEYGPLRLSCTKLFHSLNIANTQTSRHEYGIMFSNEEQATSQTKGSILPKSKRAISMLLFLVAVGRCHSAKGNEAKQRDSSLLFVATYYHVVMIFMLARGDFESHGKYL